MVDQQCAQTTHCGARLIRGDRDIPPSPAGNLVPGNTHAVRDVFIRCPPHR